MKVKNKRGIRIPTRILVSALLLVIQLIFIFYTVYSYSSGSAFAYLGSAFASALTVIIIINRRGNPDHKIAWIVFILVSPYLE